MSAHYGFFDFVAELAWQWTELTVTVAVIALVAVIFCNWQKEAEKKMDERREDGEHRQ